MSISKLSSEYIDRVKKNPSFYYKDYLKAFKAVENSTAYYKGKPVPFLYQPILYTEKEIENFKNIGKTLMSISNKMVKKYVECPKFRKKFQYSPLLEELILADHGYKVNVPIARFDIFYSDEGEFKFCELNTDGSSAMNEDNTLAKILLDTEILKELKEIYNIDYFELFDSWVEESINIFREFNKNIENPTVAIVDFSESGTPAEFEEFKKAYIKKGFNAIISDPRELKYKNGKLYDGDTRIDLVYRRIVTRELIDRNDEIQDFIMAYKDKAICVIGPIKSQIMHNKIIFKILHDEDTLELLTEEERNFVKNHIPLTLEFGNDVSIYNEAFNNKDKYVIKPMDLYASKGVYVGRDFSTEEWKIKLDEAWGQHYLLQEFCVPYKRELIEFIDEKPAPYKFNHILGLFMYNEKLAGLYSRVGKNNVISGVTDYYTVPNLVVENKNK